MNEMRGSISGEGVTSLVRLLISAEPVITGDRVIPNSHKRHSVTANTALKQIMIAEIIRRDLEALLIEAIIPFCELYDILSETAFILREQKTAAIKQASTFDM